MMLGTENKKDDRGRWACWAWSRRISSTPTCWPDRTFRASSQRGAAAPVRRRLRPSVRRRRRARPPAAARGDVARPRAKSSTRSIWTRTRPTGRDPKTIDPTLQLDRFAKVQSVELAGGARNVFQFAAAPPPKAAEAAGEQRADRQAVREAWARSPPPPAAASAAAASAADHAEVLRLSRPRRTTARRRRTCWMAKKSISPRKAIR